MSVPAGDGIRRGLDSAPVTGLPWNASSWPGPVAPAAGGRPRMCRHLPPCPPPQARDCLAARVISRHPEQGWSLLCNGVVVFEDTGARLPDGSVIEPERATRQPGAAGVTQAGHARTVAPVPAGRAREGGLRRPGPVMAGAALVTSPPGPASGSQQPATRVHAWRVPAQALPPARGLQEKVTADAW
jgi:hypothetical protein